MKICAHDVKTTMHDHQGDWLAKMLTMFNPQTAKYKNPSLLKSILY
jgi:hypothetical protein